MDEIKVLIITYYWPPAGGGGVQRWFHFSKYLAAKGIAVTVLTVRENDASYPLLDYQLTESVRNIETYKTKSIDPLKFYSKITSGNSKDNIPYGGFDAEKSIFKRIAAWVRANLFIPDARIGWNKYAINKAKEILNQGYSHIITTGPPQSSHLIGLQLKKNFPNIIWFADLRDPWTELYINETLPQTVWAKKKNLKLEKQCLDAADKIITVGNELKHLLASKTATPIEVIYNGFEEELFQGKTFLPSNTFTILHVGLLGIKQDCNAFAKALADLVDKFPNQKFKFVIIGKIVSLNAELLENIPNLNFENLGYLPQQETIDYMFKADLLLNITPQSANESIMISTKTMEYLRTKRPTLVLSNQPKEFAFLFKNEKLLKTAHRDKTEDIFNAIETIYKSYLENPMQNSMLDVSEYSREAGTGKLISLLKA